MRAWRAHELGTAEEVLKLEEVPAPTPGPGQLLIEVEAVGLNFPDNLMVAGQYQVKPELPFTPGMELSGRVIAAGEGTTTAVGQRVIAVRLNVGGALAEQVVVTEQDAFPIPAGMDAVDAAAVFVTYLTGHVGLHRRAGLRSGEVLLVHAGAGGVGSAAIQLGKAAGARVIATAGGPEKVAVCRQLGADMAIDYLAEDFVQIVKDETGGRGADVIYDPVGGDIFDRSRRCVAWEGRILIVGFTGGRIAQAPTNHMLLKNYGVLGVYMGEYLVQDPAVLREAHDDVMRLYQAGAVRPLIGERVPLDDVPGALTRLASRRSVGKLVVQVR